MQNETQKCKVLICVSFLLMALGTAPATAAVTDIAALCANTKQNNASISAEYQPGIDVHGNDVTPADLSEFTALHNPISIPIDVDLAERYGIDLPLGVELKPEIARLDIHQNGDVFYNGKKLSADIEKLCKEYRQNQDNPVISQQAKVNAKSPQQVQGSEDLIQGLYPPQ